MENIRKTLMLPKDILDRIEQYRKENYLGSFTNAVVQLVIKGLESEGGEQQWHYKEP